jgi:AAA domain, putative AbiEii toxin, Type IV TA system
MQPLLLLKQTLEAGYDPGPLLLDGPHVRFSNPEQILSKVRGRFAGEEFKIGFESDRRDSILEVFRRREDGQGFDLVESELSISGRKLVLRVDEKNLDTERVKALSPAAMSFINDLYKGDVSWNAVRLRCFLSVTPTYEEEDWVEPAPERVFGGLLRRILHIPGLRGNPERSYNTSAVGEVFPGTFESYVASIILAWQEASDKRIDLLGQALEALGLTWRIVARPLDATRVELLVARLPRKGKSAKGDLVNIADVGLSVSQVLPALVALLIAEPGQLVYVEQPEFHLHPQAQQALALILAEAAGRGVRVVAETHSAILLLAVQTLVAQGRLTPDKVKLHWFQRDARGATQVTSADLDQLGAYGDWPVDFGEVEAQIDNAYLDAVDARAFQQKKKNARK